MSSQVGTAPAPFQPRKTIKFADYLKRKAEKEANVISTAAATGVPATSSKDQSAASDLLGTLAGTKQSLDTEEVSPSKRPCLSFGHEDGASAPGVNVATPTPADVFMRGVEVVVPAVEHPAAAARIPPVRGVIPAWAVRAPSTEVVGVDAAHVQPATAAAASGAHIPTFKVGDPKRMPPWGRGPQKQEKPQVEATKPQREHLQQNPNKAQTVALLQRSPYLLFANDRLSSEFQGRGSATRFKYAETYSIFNAQELFNGVKLRRLFIHPDVKVSKDYLIKKLVEEDVFSGHKHIARRVALTLASPPPPPPTPPMLPTPQPTPSPPPPSPPHPPMPSKADTGMSAIAEEILARASEPLKKVRPTPSPPSRAAPAGRSPPAGSKPTGITKSTAKAKGKDVRNDKLQKALTTSPSSVIESSESETEDDEPVRAPAKMAKKPSRKNSKIGKKPKKDPWLVEDGCTWRETKPSKKKASSKFVKD